MILIAHVSIALASLVWTSYLYLQPSRRKFYAGYGLIIATLASGTYLVISAHAPLLSACVSGLLYLAVVWCGTLLAYRKFAAGSLNL